MSIERNDLSREPSADDVDLALHSFWSGSSAALDRLIENAGGSEASGPSVGAILSAVVQVRQHTTCRLPSPIPGYRILRELGRGGMAVVYEAVQEATGQTVALKRLPAWGGAAAERSARLLEREIRTLGRLRHPGIAALYDAGQDDDGCHFFAMEFVTGRPITASIDGPVRDKADRHERLARFVDLCAAVDYAHQRGVIHCDLKPTNVFVDDAGRPRVLDFGLARLLEADAGQTIGVSAIGPVGTLSHMSPEQTSGRFDEIDVRTDVYSLGVILFEYLTGGRPYDVHVSALAEAVRTICELPTRRPSGLAPLLRGDVETIILKALEKSPDRRYASVAALSDDVQRVLQNRPIQARPPSAGYIFGRWCARHRLPTALLAVLFGLIATFGFVLVGKNRELSIQRDKAREESIRLAQANVFLADLFATVDPRVVGADVSVRAILDHAAEVIDTALPDQPAVRAELHQTAGRGYFALTQYKLAADEFAKAVTLFKTVYGESDARTAEAIEHHGLTALNCADRATADHDLRQAYDIRVALFGEDDLTTAKSLASRAEYHRYFDFAEAERLLRQALGIRERHSQDALLLADTRYALGRLFVEAGRYADAEPLLTQARDAWKQSGDPDRFEIAQLLNYLGELHGAQGELYQAARDYREDIRILEKISGGRDNRYWAHALSDLAGILTDLGQLIEAEDLNRRAVAMELAAGNDPNAALTRHNYASFLRKTARYEEAEALERQVYRAWDGGNNTKPQPGRAYSAQCLGMIHLETGRLDEAEKFLIEADNTWRSLLGDDSARRTSALTGLGRIDFRQGRYEEAAAKLRQAHDLSEKHHGAAAAETLLARFDWLRVRDGARPTPDTLAEMQAALAQLLPRCVSVRRETARAINTLAELLLTASPPRPSSAKSLLADALSLETEAGMEHHPTHTETLRLLSTVDP